MLAAQTALASIGLLISLTGCDIPRGTVQLRDNGAHLRFVDGDDGIQEVLLCNNNSCTKAPDNEYKTAAGMTIPVQNGLIYFVEHPTTYCNYAPKDNQEHLDCEDRN